MLGCADLRVAVIGAGLTGIVAGRELLAQGFTQFTIFEKAGAVGGTWHLHSYPGLACDVRAAAYTFEQEPNPDWTHTFVERHEIGRTLDFYRFFARITADQHKQNHRT